jgi:hypothetical protein
MWQRHRSTLCWRQNEQQQQQQDEWCVRDCNLGPLATAVVFSLLQVWGLQDVAVAGTVSVAGAFWHMPCMFMCKSEHAVSVSLHIFSWHVPPVGRHRIIDVSTIFWSAIDDDAMVSSEALGQRVGLGLCFFRGPSTVVALRLCVRAPQGNGDLCRTCSSVALRSCTHMCFSSAFNLFLLLDAY